MSAEGRIARWTYRGCFAACACLAAASPAIGLAPERRFQFEVFLDGKPLGTHQFAISGDPDSVATVQSDANFNYRILGIKVYHYRHRAHERWIAGCLDSVEAQTDDNGNERYVEGARREGSFYLTAPQGMAPLTGCTSTYTYWDRDRLLRQNRLLNPQTGKADAVSVEQMGAVTLDSADGPVAADRYRIHVAGKLIDLWYSPAGDWLQLETAVESGRRLVYRRLARSSQDAGMVTTNKAPRPSASTSTSSPP